MQCGDDPISWNCDDNEELYRTRWWLWWVYGSFERLWRACQNSSDNSWNCIDAEGCVELDNDSGEYSSLNDCEMACENNSENSWNCDDNEGYFELDDDSGEFNSLNDCEAVCNVFVESYNCVDNACVIQWIAQGLTLI